MDLYKFHNCEASHAETVGLVSQVCFQPRQTCKPAAGLAALSTQQPASHKRYIISFGSSRIFLPLRTTWMALALCMFLCVSARGPARPFWAALLSCCVPWSNLGSPISQEPHSGHACSERPAKQVRTHQSSRAKVEKCKVHSNIRFPVCLLADTCVFCSCICKVSKQR